MSPFILPAPTVALYAILNALAVCIIAFCLHWAIFLSWRSLLLIFPPAIVTAVFAIAVMRRTQVLLSKSEPVTDSLARMLRDRFFPFGAHVNFRVAEVPDARALESNDQAICLLTPAQQGMLLSDHSGASGSGTKTALTIVAHELGHVLSGDARDFEVCLRFVIAGTVYLAIAWIVLLLGGARFHWHIGIALLYFLAVQMCAVYHVIRIREYFADKIASIIYEEQAVLATLTSLAQMEKFIRFQWGYFVTHPSFKSRVMALSDFRLVYDYSLVNCFIAAFALSAFDYAHQLFVISYGRESAEGIARNFGLLAASIPPFTVIILAWTIESIVCCYLVIPATLCNRLDYPGMFLRSTLIAGLMFFNFALFKVCVYGDFSLAFSVLRSRDNIGFVLSVLTLTWVYFLSARYLLTFEGPKKVDGSFIVKLLVLGGVTAFGLIQSVNDIFDWILSWVLSDGPGMVLSVSAALGVLVFVIFLASLQHHIRASARRWSGDCIRRMPRFAKEEWYAIAYYSICATWHSRLRSLADRGIVVCWRMLPHPTVAPRASQHGIVLVPFRCIGVDSNCCRCEPQVVVDL